MKNQHKFNVFLFFNEVFYLFFVFLPIELFISKLPLYYPKLILLGQIGKMNLILRGIIKE